MKSYTKVFLIIIFSIFFEFYIIKNVDAEQRQAFTIDVEKQVNIDSEKNGVCYDYNKITLDISNIKIILPENKSIEPDLIDNKEDLLRAKFYINCIDSLNNLEIAMHISAKEYNIEKDVSLGHIAIEELKNKRQFLIGKDILKNFLSYDIIFKVEEGGYLFDDNNEKVNYEENIRIIEGSKFPKIPQINIQDGYSFLGWYNLEDNIKVENFDSIVTKNAVYVAKFSCEKNTKFNIENSKKDLFLDDKKKLEPKIFNKNLDKIESNDEKNIKEQNVFRKLLSYLLNLVIKVEI